jgi:hypothetical protein
MHTLPHTVLLRVNLYKRPQTESRPVPTLGTVRDPRAVTERTQKHTLRHSKIKNYKKKTLNKMTTGLNSAGDKRVKLNSK